MNRIDQFFQQGKKAFVPYVTAGHPDVAESTEVLALLVEQGADILELGFPFSDPTADGPVIQASSQHALERGFSRADYFSIIQKFREQDRETPLVAFTYYNPVFSMGVENFVRTVAEAGADAMLVVDLPFEERAEICPALDKYGLHPIQLIAPTTPTERAKRILAVAVGFVYQIALKGVTGMRQSLAEDAIQNVKRTRALTELPVCMGFGVSTGDHARAVAQAADGVVVGSALVKCISDHLPDYHEPLRALTRELAAATHSI